MLNLTYGAVTKTLCPPSITRNAFGTGLSEKNQGDKRTVINSVTDYNWTKAFRGP